MFRKSISFFCFLFITGIPSGFAQTSSVDGVIEFAVKKADSLYRESKVPGIFIGISNNDINKYIDLGYADPDNKIRFDSLTVFEAGSVTKTFTAYIVAAVLKEKGIPDTVSISKYLPDSVQSNRVLEKISFLNLLNHTSGLPRLPDNMGMAGESMSPYDQYNAAKLFEYLKTAVPKPNGKSNYSNLGMGLAGVLAEMISGKSYEALLEHYIFVPFNIGSIKNLPGKSGIKSQGYFNGEKSSFWNMDVLAPAGGLKCSATEMLAYLNYMSRPLNKAIGMQISNLLEPTVVLNKKVNVCRGWLTYEQQGKPAIYWHNGGTFGFSTFAAFIKETRQAVIVVVNKFNQNMVSDALGMEIMKKMLE